MGLVADEDHFRPLIEGRFKNRPLSPWYLRFARFLEIRLRPRIHVPEASIARRRLAYTELRWL